jgi:hypothetical protein
MPAMSKSQWRLMQAAEHGAVKVPGLSKKEAHEFTKGQSYKDLPEKKAVPAKKQKRGKKKGK